MKVEQYRLVKQSAGGWRVQMTYGLLDTTWLTRIFHTLQEARNAAKAHAAKTGNSSPIILR